DLIARRDQRMHPQSAIGLNPDNDLVRLVSMTSDEIVEHTNPRESLRQSLSRNPRSGLVHQMNVVMIFCPVVADEQHRCGPLPRVGYEPENRKQRANASVIESRHPISAYAVLTNRPGHDLTLGINVPAASSAHRPAAQTQPLTRDRTNP